MTWSLLLAGVGAVAVIAAVVFGLLAKLDRREARLDAREERLTERAHRLEVRADDLSRREEALLAERSALADVAAERRALLAATGRLTEEQARTALMSDMLRDARRDAARAAEEIERSARADAQKRARMIVATAAQRIATEQTAQSVVSVVHLASDDLKGRIIGREGRNIRAFEQVTGVNLIVDDAPEGVLLSCFDPVRREVARLTLEELLADGRIHPSRIEEVHERCATEVDLRCQRAGEEVVTDFGIVDIDPDLVLTLGRLRYRTSYGQEVLAHLVESGRLAGLLAAELGVDPTLVRRAALLHDIGKALTHEQEGSHALVGADFARRHGEAPDVVHAIEAHHGEVEPRTVEAILTQAADAMSGGRPGARREAPEAFVHRMQRLEEIALSAEGVEKVFAMRAGRELRVMVVPQTVDDIGAQLLARDIAKQIEHELSFPGQITVTVIRESRATEIAR